MSEQNYQLNLPVAGAMPAAASSGSGTQQVYFGASPPAAPDNPALPAIWYPTAGGQGQTWTGSAWV